MSLMFFRSCRGTRSIPDLFSNLLHPYVWDDTMADPLESFLAELEQLGKTNDSSTPERARKMLNITRDTGEFLAVLIRATLARRVLEIGTSNGYSTLWLASAARAIGGSVTTVEFSDYKIGLASKNFDRSGLASLYFTCAR